MEYNRKFECMYRCIVCVCLFIINLIYMYCNYYIQAHPIRPV